MSEFDGYITRLLAVEKEAEARVRQAEVEAEHIKEQAAHKAKEKIDKLRVEMEREFQSNRIDNSDVLAVNKRRTDEDIEKDLGLYTKNKDVVIDMLVDRVMSVRYELPRNVKKDYSELKGPVR
jgi:F0F1-type ATP synthase membrane subunit b/b'